MKQIDLKELLKRYRYPLIVLAFGLFLLLSPALRSDLAVDDTPGSLQDLLCQAEGVGEAHVLISDAGVVVVCQGAADPSVRLDILKAVNSYTGFGADKVTILKMKE